jgi:hypothetical protein
MKDTQKEIFTFNKAILSICIAWDSLSIKTISRYCPFNLATCQKFLSCNPQALAENSCPATSGHHKL